MQTVTLRGSPLSDQQAHLWSMQKDNQVYRILCAIQVQGGYDRDRFKNALEQVIERHEILRTAFHSLPGMDIPMQVISGHALWSYTEISLEQLATPEQHRKIDELFAALQKETYDLQQGPLLLARLCYLHASHQILLLSLPALCADNYSLKLLIEEFLNACTNYVPVEEPLQYADVSAWQEEQLLEEEATTQREYWRKIDLSAVTDVKLPFQYEMHRAELRASEQFAPREVEITIPESLVHKIEMQAQLYDVPVSVWLLTCWKVLLWRLCNETAFPVGIACDGRNYEDLLNALGPYTRFVPVDARIEKSRPFALVLASVNASLQEAVKRQLYFTWEYEPVKGDAAKHFFPVLFEYDISPAAFEAGRLTVSLLKRWSCTEPFVFKLSALQVGEQMHLDLYYDPLRITLAQASSLASLFQTLLEQVTEQPQNLIGTVSLLSAEASAYLRSIFSGPRRSWPKQGLPQLFEAQVLHRPGALAVISRQEQLTYQQLNARANQLAQVLRRRGVGPNVLVGLCLARQASMLVALLGILKAGGAYLPLDAGSPQTRLRYQLQESGAVLLLTQEEQREHLPLDWVGSTLYLEALAEELAQALPENQEAESQSGELAYVIYTSGSTGTPKGVMVSQQSIVNYTQSLCEQLGAQEGWQYATVSTLAADLGNTAIFCALASGGCVQVLEYEQVTSAEAMVDWTQAHPIDVLKIVPSHLSALLENERGRAFLPRQALVLGGEALPESLLERIAELGGACAVYNHYGPTETTIGVLMHMLGVQRTKDGSKQERKIALGRPIANTQVYVLDGRMQEVPQGVRGELYIGGVGLAWGYVGQGGQTAERFVPDPYSEQEGARLYRTGDLAQYGQEGLIEFMGRADGQVKLRGYRVEVGEIEAVLRQHPQMRESVVVLRSDGGGEPRLVGYLVSHQRVNIVRGQLDVYMRERLPEYMLPMDYVLLEAWPLTANGKVDRQHLPQPEQSTRRKVRSARGPIEELIAQVWQELLGTEIGIHENFFEVGGHSLLATRLMARIRAVLPIDLPVRAAFEAPTVAEFAQWVEQALRENEEIPIIPSLIARERPEEIPLSYAQQRLWFLSQLEPESTAYLASRTLKMRGSLDVPALERSLQELICRHESLRTTFAERAGQPVQVIHQRSRASLPMIDLQGLQQERRVAEARWLASQEAQRPCDLVWGPLLRTSLLRLGSQEHIFLLTLHHIITDGWSNEVLVREFATLYQACVDGLSSPLAPLLIQYADYALWQREWLQGEMLEAQLAYWRKQLANVPSLALPTDYSRTSGHTYRGAVLSLALPEELSQRLITLSQQEAVTLFMLLLTAFQVLLTRYTGQTDISVGTPIANRMRAEIEDVVGFFVNTLVMRTDLSGNPTFLQMLQRVREVCLDAYTHQDVPFEKLIEALQPERDVSRSSLFQVSFQFAHDIDTAHLIPGLSLESPGTDGASADYDLRVMMTQFPQGFSCTAFYDTNLFAEQTIRRFLEHFQTLLQGVVLAPEKPIAVLPLLSERERQRQLVEWNETRRDYPQDLCVHQLFEQQVQRTPDAIALVFENAALTYAMLNRRANQLAYHLQALGVGPEVLVGICMERSIEIVLGLLAVLKAGGAYVPLDPSLPRERLEFMLEDTQVALVLSQAHLQQRLALDGMTLIDMATASLMSDSSFQANPTSVLQPDQLVYMIYTSGSTGKPKGVMNVHHGLVNRLTWMQQHYPLSENDRILQKTPFSFDVSVWEFFWPLIAGARLVVAQSGGHQDPTYIKELIRQEQITILHFVPAMLQAFLSDPTNIQVCTSLQRVMCSGEALSAELQARFFALTDASLHNLYGPTEASIDVTFWDCLPDEQKQSVPIGYPIANTQIYLLDHELQPTPIGVVGDVYIGGDGLARGYFRRPDLTAERFLPNPFSSSGGERFYRTGDVARYLPTGAIDFLGRVDEQIKLRGYRIELGEIEATLRDHPAVQEAVVIIREDRSGDSRLVAYTVLDLLHAGIISQDVQSPLVAERLKRWQELYDGTYRQATHQTLQTFNTVGWNSSYTGQPIAIEEMQAWLEDTLALVRSYHPERIWEIGCGIGLLLFPLSSTCMHYYGTDFSAVALEEVRQHLAYLKQERGIQPAVTLLQRQADDFGAAPEEQIDTVLINSVVQYFPNIDYLLRVLEGAIRLVAPGGRIVVGDIRSFPLLEAFHADVQLYRAPDTLTRQQLWQQVQHHLQQEKELVLDPTFFWRWAQTTGRIRRVEVHLKRGRQQNELTHFRYQVVLHVGEPLSARSTGRQQVEEEELNCSEQASTREYLRQKLSRDQPHRLRLRQVPNARLDQSVQTVQWLKSQQGPETVGQWRTELSTRASVGLDPEDLRDDAEEFGYHVVISWGQHGSDGCYSALLQRKDGDLGDDTEEELLPLVKQSEPVYDWSRSANQPLWGEAERLFVPQIRQYLQERLPDYMVPASLEVLRELPLTPSGKIDRRALPAPEANQQKEQLAQNGPETPIEELIGELWSDILGRSSIGIHKNFFALGGHSLLVTQLVARIRSALEVEMPVRVAFEVPTIAGMARWVEQALCKGEKIEMPPLLAVAYPEEIPLSFAQQRLWFLDQLTPNSTTYLNSGLLCFRGMLNSRALEWSIQEIVQRHESLRTTFTLRAEQPVQVIHPAGRFVLPIVDLRNLRAEQRANEARALAQQESQHPCDLIAGPLFKIYLLRLESQEHMMVLSQHHIITDGWSNDVLVRELAVLYRSYVAGQPSPLAPLPIQYADYALWQRQWLQGEMLQRHIAYWQQQLKGATPLMLPADAPRTARQNDYGARYSFELATELSAKLASFSRREGVTLFMTLLAAFQILLYRLSGQPDIVVGTDVANRTHVETEGLIGFFVNLLALRTNMRGAPSFRKVVQQVRAMVLGAYTHQELPFELVIEHVQVKRKEHQNPLIQVLFVMQNTPSSRANLPDLELEIIDRESATARFDLALFVQETPTGIRGSVVYRAELFTAQTIATWMRQFEVLLGNIVAKPDIAIDVLELHTDEEKMEQIKEKLAKRHLQANRIRATKSKVHYSQGEAG